MKNYILYALVFITITGYSQDTLTVESVDLQFNNSGTFLFNDSLDFNYNVSTTGDPVITSVRTHMTVKNTWVFNNVEQEVLEDTVVSDADFSQSAEVNIVNRVVLRSSVFKNGNNTVVIWPEKVGETTIVKDSVKFIVEISDESIESVNNAPLLDLVQVRSSENYLNLMNTSVDALTIRVYSISGKEVLLSELESGAEGTWFLKTGVYFLTTVKGNTYYVHKMIIQ